MGRGGLLPRRLGFRPISSWAEGWGSWKGCALGNHDCRLADLYQALFPARTHSSTGPSWLQSRYTALHTFPPCLTLLWPSFSTPSSFTHALFLAFHLHLFFSLLQLPLPSHLQSAYLWLHIPTQPKGWSPLHPFLSPSLDQQLSVDFPVSLCIILQSLSSHPVTVHTHFCSSHPVITDYLYFDGTFSELLPPFNPLAQLCFFHTFLQTILLLASPSQHEVYPARYQPLLWFVSFFFFLCSLSLTTDGFARFLDSVDFLPLSPCPTLQLPCCFLREDISNSRSHTRKFSFLLITSDSSLHSSICFHFSLQRSTPPSKDRRWTRSLHTLLPSFVPLFLWLHHETGYKGGEFCCSLSWMWPLHCISRSFPLNIAKSLSTFLFSYYKCTLVFPLQKSCQP